MTRRRPALGLVAFFLLLVACAGEPAEGADTMSPDTVDGATLDATPEDVVPQDADISSPDGAESDGSDVAEDTAEVDATVGDAVDCSVARVGCPCIPDADTPCCLFEGTGLECSGYFSQWERFNDCGCSTLPECSSDPLYDLCPQ